MRPLLAALACLLALAGCSPGGGRTSAPDGAPRRELLVAAAASLQDVLQAAAADFAAVRPDITVRFHFGSSGALAQQIGAGAPAGLFIAAGKAPVEGLVQKGLVDPRQVWNLASNRVVLIAPRAGGPPLRSWQDLLGEGVQRVAIGDPAHVPAGQYGQQVLQHLGLWQALAPKLVLDQDVRQVLHHVAAGAAQAGIVYATDAASEPRVTVVAEAPPGSHRPVEYPMAVVKGAKEAEPARALAEFLLSERGQAIFRRFGFGKGG